MSFAVLDARPLSRRRPALHAASAALLVATTVASCDEATPLSIARCGSDLECAPGEICEMGACVSKDTVSCTQIEGGRAILQPTPHRLDLETAGTSTITLRNIGDCTLTLFEARIVDAETSPYACASCAADQFPIELFPFRERALAIDFAPTRVGRFPGSLEILSDDAEFPTLVIPIAGRFDGAPAPRVVPETVDFGYSPVGQSATRTVTLTNRGTGVAELTVTGVRVEPTATTAFSLEPAPSTLVRLAPVEAEPTAALGVQIRYRPSEVGTHAAALVFETSAGTVRAELRGTSESAPEISVSPERVSFGELPLGSSDARTLLIQNPGGAPLTVRARFGGPGAGGSTDFSLAPQVIPPIPPGGYVEAQVFATATAPRALQGLLVLETNAPARPTVTVPLAAQGRPVQGAQVLKIEMSYGNDANSFFDDDVRNVDMHLENPFGLVCGKHERMPTNWGPFGHPSWLAFGPKEEPERIVLPDATQDGTFRVLLTYAEDCSSVPTGLVASVLGVSVDVLIGYFSGGAVPLDGEDVSRVIGDLCVSRSAASVVVTVYANGEVIQEVPVSLARKGDTTYALDIVRSEGTLHVAP